VKKLFEIADKYLQQSDWKTISVLKICLISMGTIIGMLMPKKAKKPAFITCGACFAASYIPLMYKFFKIAERELK